jgi:hypothetical protein
VAGEEDQIKKLMKKKPEVYSSKGYWYSMKPLMK